MGLDREAPRPALVGRGDLLDHLERTLRDHGRVALTGPPGIGKTALVAAVARPRERRARGETVLWLAPEEEDRDIPGAGAAGLLDDMPEEVLRQLPRPQRAAVAVARRETEAPAAGQDRVALRLAVAQALRLIAAGGPVLLVVDNAQWLDPDSSALLRFALHKAPPAVRALVAERQHTSPLHAETLFGHTGPRVVHVPPLGADHIAALLADHELPARLAGRIHRAGGGNPRLALAIGRSLAGTRTFVHHADELPPGGEARAAARRMLAEVPAEAHPTLLLAALATGPTTTVLRRAGRTSAEADLAAAERAGLVTVGEDGAVAFTAEVVPATLAAEADWDERAACHAALAEAVGDPVQAVRHRALASDPRDAGAEIAGELDRALEACRRRGDRALAAELGLLAAERTPAGHPEEEVARLLGAAADAAGAARPDLSRRAADAILARDVPPAARLSARLAILDTAFQGLTDLDETFSHALADAGDDPSMRAAVLVRLVWKQQLADGDSAAARATAEEAYRLALAAGDRGTAVLAATARARISRALGEPEAEAHTEEALTVWREGLPPALRNGPRLLACRHALFDDRLTEAREGLLALLPELERLGTTEDLVVALRSLAEVEARQGQCAAALAHARRAVSIALEAGFSPGPLWYSAALAETAGGSFRRAADYARRSLRASQEEGDQVFVHCSLYALGRVQLAMGETALALETLGGIRDLPITALATDPSVLRWHEELAEAYVAGGEPERAADLLAEVTPVARRLGRTTVLTALDRVRGQYLAATGDPDAGAELLRETADRFTAHGLPIEAGRTLLALARTERRRRRRAAAQAVLREAAGVFDRAGARPWARLAGGAPPRGGAEPFPGGPAGFTERLTEAERRLALLVGQGASNQEAAARLFLSVKTVEARLTRIYRKLGVRGRAQLAVVVRDD
ncbi:helix-turn-helix transcriptional regulator [Streptomyces pini]|uniref:Transcriptional regulator n=1 Tax=Streptomyces pini TaxID=1520580 RepID=A0A1I4ICC9_9ACTN|nr:LuxR family transcriptional regulator [Streptomyces pini]SFL51955.1 transcriptional regulator [Streptomyces pini]